MASDVTDIDIAALDSYFRAHVAGYSGPLSAQKFATGQSNPTFFVEAASGKYVLRRKPPGALLKSAHAIEREYAVMQALAPTAVPVPRMLALCEDASVIGTPFYVMAHVDGRIFWDPAVPEATRADRAAIYDEMNLVLAALHGVDPQAEIGRAHV